MRLRDLPIILVAALLMSAGGWRVATSDDTEWTGAALVAAGMVVLGFWLSKDGDD